MDLFIAIKLAKQGFFQGDPEKVLNARADIVLALVDFEIFDNKFQKLFVEINRE